MTALVSTARRWLRNDAVVFVLLAGALVLVLVAISVGVFVGLDRASFGFLHHHHHHSPLLLIAFAPVSAACLLGAVVIIWPRATRGYELCMLAVVFCVLEVCELLGKLYFVQPAGRLNSIFVGLALPYSAPSGHAMRATLLFGMLALRLDRRWRPILGICLVLVCLALVGYSYHYLSDTIVGVLLGSLGLVVMKNISKPSASATHNEEF
jgi:membrane-associated phospholipid phosphatase